MAAYILSERPTSRATSPLISDGANVSAWWASVRATSICALVSPGSVPALGRAALATEAAYSLQKPPAATALTGPLVAVLTAGIVWLDTSASFVPAAADDLAAVPPHPVIVM